MLVLLSVCYRYSCYQYTTDRSVTRCLTPVHVSRCRSYPVPHRKSHLSYASHWSHGLRENGFSSRLLFLYGKGQCGCSLCSSDMRNSVVTAKALAELGGESRRNWSFLVKTLQCTPPHKRAVVPPYKVPFPDFPLTDPSVPACRCSPVLMFTLVDVARCQCSPNTVCRCI